MMRLPNGEVIMHSVNEVYDPAKAHEYYMRTRHLTGRKRGQTAPPPTQNNVSRVQAKQQLARRITQLEGKLAALDDLIKKKEAALKRGQETMRNRNKKPTAADKSKKAEEAKKYRHAHRQELATKAKQAAQKSGGGGDGKAGTAKPDSQKPIKELKMLATKVRGQLQAAKTKLNAL